MARQALQTVILQNSQPDGILTKKKGWNMLRSSTRCHMFNLVVIEPEMSEKFKMID